MEDKIESILRDMTLEEKAAMFVGADNWHSRRLDRVGIPALRMTDGPHGTRTIPDETPSIHEGLPATCFPTASALAATWNTELVRKVGAALGVETRAKGCDILLGPAVNIHRTPLGGRNFEYFSEDPYLAARMAVAYIKGLQSQGVGASIKHFACNNSEFERFTISSEVGERALREIYLPAFKAAVLEAQPWTVMCSYNKINGVYASENRYLLTEILKEEWDFEGFVVSDWGAVHDRVKSANAGLDLEMPGSPDRRAEELVEAVKEGTVAEETLDDKIRRILRIAVKAGAFEGPKAMWQETTNTPEQQRLAREAACEAVVLLKNEGGLLPLDEGTVEAIAVFGTFAETPTIEGGGSSRVTPYYTVSPLEGLRERCGDAVRVEFDPGRATETGALVLEAPERVADLAARCDVAVVFAGLPDGYETEGSDRPDMELPGDQVALIRTVAAANPRTVVVLQNGAPVAMSAWIEDVSAVVESWYGGQECGNAVAAVLLGDVNPSGKLPTTFPRRLQDTPAYINYPGESGRVLYGEGIFVGYRYYDKKEIEPLFPFGHGLSYTTFEYSDLTLSAAEVSADDELQVSVDVTNTGSRAGKEVVQLYVRDVEARLVRPPKELKGFQKVRLAQGETKTIRFTLDQSALAYYDPVQRTWIAEAGDFEVLIGSSSRDIRATARFRLKGSAAARSSRGRWSALAASQLSADTKLRTIFQDGRGRAVLKKHLGPMLDDPRFHMALDLSLNELSAFVPDHLPPEVVAAIDEDLRNIE